MGFRELDIEIDYTGRGEEILRRFLLPLLGSAVQYDRVTSFFTTDSLVAIAEGLDALWANHGRMRLVLGVHDVPEELAHAAVVSDDPVGELVAGVRARILSQIATIQGEIAVRRLATIAWMIQDGLLEARVAAPRSLSLGPPGLFHNKAFILSDANGDVVAGVGSPNETGAGLGHNIEHVTVFSSWEQPRYTEAQARYFDDLWEDRREDVTVRRLDDSFAGEVLRALGVSLRPAPAPATRGLRVQEVLDVAAEMPAFALVSGIHAALYPHQQRAFLDALSRWPVRVMLADEVGLGKTFEAGAVLKYLLKHTTAQRALVLAPKAVVYQWQAELAENFDLRAWAFDSGRRAFLSPDDQVHLLAPGEPVLGPASPDLVIMSAQYARGTRNGGHVLGQATQLPDVLIVDEAHAARVRPDLDGSERPTLMWRLLNDVMKMVPHVIFATATPMQVHWREYHALLELLGLPSEWAKPANYERSLSIISEDDAPTLQDAAHAAALICSSASEMRPALAHLSSDERTLLERLLECGEDSFKRASVVTATWETARTLLTKLHPAHLLTVRNTRTALESVGYCFPTRNLTAPALNVPEDVRTFYAQVEDYLSDVYFNVERALFPERKFNVGFVKCSYQQRLASSLEACRLSMSRRRDRVQAIIENTLATAGIEAETEELLESDVFDEGEVYEVVVQEVPTPFDEAQVLHEARIEVQWLDGLLSSVGRILARVPDPKITQALGLVKSHLGAGDSVLVFSRYTDTLDAVIQAHCHECAGSVAVPYGVYTGQSAILDLGLGPHRSTRGEIRRALDQGAVRLVFCSDAASEGLNLQAARALINVDVPWNPSRLEQRVGRIARLGQKASTVDVYNLWYPDSIEARMYKRLIDRKDLYDLAVGEFPEVVSAAIRAEVASRYGGPEADSDPLIRLQQLRTDVQLAALRRLWARDASGETLARQFRNGLAALAIGAALAEGGQTRAAGGKTMVEVGPERFSFTLEPGSEDVISLKHAALRCLGRRRVVAIPEVRLMVRDAAPVFFATEADEAWQPIAPESLPALLGRLSAIPLEQQTVAVLVTTSDGRPISEWMPDALNLLVAADLECDVPQWPEYRIPELTLTGLGEGGERPCA